MQRIKQIAKKVNDTLTNIFPLGVDSVFTDMKSGLDLEEEFQIGGNTLVEINLENLMTTIILYYYLNNIDWDSELRKNFYYYKKVTKIKDKGNNVFHINVKLFLKKEQNEVKLHLKYYLIDENGIKSSLDYDLFTASEYLLTDDTTIVQGKTYYIKSGDNYIRIDDPLDYIRSNYPAAWGNAQMLGTFMKTRFYELKIISQLLWL